MTEREHAEWMWMPWAQKVDRVDSATQKLPRRESNRGQDYVGVSTLSLSLSCRQQKIASVTDMCPAAALARASKSWMNLGFEACQPYTSKKNSTDYCCSMLEPLACKVDHYPKFWTQPSTRARGSWDWFWWIVYKTLLIQLRSLYASVWSHVYF